MKRLFLSFIMGVSFSPLMAQVAYPTAPRDNTVDEYFGFKVDDHFRPLENDTAMLTAKWVIAENAVTDKYMSRIPFKAKIQKRLTQLFNYAKEGIPAKHHGRYYVYKNDGLQNQYVLHTFDKLGDATRVFLDPNKLSDDGTVALKSVSFSHDGLYAAYSISRSGSDWEEIYVLDVKTGKQLDDHILWAKFSSPAWCGDGFYYSAYDAPVEGKEFSNVNETHKIYYHKLGTPQSSDVLFFQSPAHPKRFYSVSVNEEETIQYLYESGEGAGNNLFVRNLKQSDSQFIQMTSDMEVSYYPVENDGKRIIIFTNYNAPRGRLMVADLDNPGINDWKELIPEQKSVLESAEVIGGKIIAVYMQDASNHAYVYGLDGKLLHEVSLPSTGSVGFSGEKNDPECFYSFSNFTTPSSIYKYDISSNKSSLYSSAKIAFRSQDYITEQVFFKSKDGELIPMTLTYKKGLKKNGKNPVLLYGYGGFNISLTPSFGVTRLPFLEAGGVYAQANLRGGGEYGEEWHQAGTKLNKQNVFDDFIAAAEYLISEKYTCTDKLAIQGGSNGGLLVGACMTQRPDLYKVAIPQVGVMDMLRYHKFTIGWNWAPDYGTSEDSPEMFSYLRGYSPLHNLKEGVSYPATLVTTADHDDRVVPAHSFKFAARLQECQGGSAPVLIRIGSKAGHGGGKPLSKTLEEQAEIYGFIMYHLGMKY